MGEDPFCDVRTYCKPFTIVSIYNCIRGCVPVTMTESRGGAVKRIPVSEEVRREISQPKEPGQTFDALLATMAEREKKCRLREDMKRIEEDEFVDLEP